MARNYVHMRFHVVFATKHRRRTLTPTVEKRLFPYLAGIARNHDINTLAMNGAGDHVHLLLGFSPSASLSTVVKVLKCNSSRWLRSTCVRRFAWQGGFAAFSVSRSSEAHVVEYIRRQKEHHKRTSFDDELRLLLRLHDLKEDA